MTKVPSGIRNRLKSSSRGGIRLGDYLKEAREKKGMTLADVADALKLKSGQSIWDWENGKGSGIPADSLLKLVKLYGISAETAYELLLDFHRNKIEEKLSKKFETAKSRLMMGRRG